MGYMHSPDCTLTKLRTPESPRSSSCVISPYSTLPMPAQPYPLIDAPKKPSSAMGLINSLGKRPARLHSSMMGIRLSSMNWRVVWRTRRSSSVNSESYWRKSTPRNLMAGMKVSVRYELTPDPSPPTGKGRIEMFAASQCSQTARGQTYDGSRVGFAGQCARARDSVFISKPHAGVCCAVHFLQYLIDSIRLSHSTREA